MDACVTEKFDFVEANGCCLLAAGTSERMLFKLSISRDGSKSLLPDAVSGGYRQGS